MIKLISKMWTTYFLIVPFHSVNENNKSNQMALIHDSTFWLGLKGINLLILKKRSLTENPELRY